MSEQLTSEIKTSKEIERKFVVRWLPQDLESQQHELIHQGYLVIGADGSEARLRDRGGVYTQTIKSKGLLVRDEFEAEITAAQFGVWWPATEGKRLEKVRYSVPYEQHVVEVDVYRAALAGLALAEVEFKTIDIANAFTPPEWFGRDVTKDPAYKNQSLAVNGLPYDFTG